MFDECVTLTVAANKLTDCDMEGFHVAPHVAALQEKIGTDL